MNDTQMATDRLDRTADQVASEDFTRQASTTGVPIRFDDAGPLRETGGVFGSATRAMAAAVPATASVRFETALLVRQAGYFSRSAYTDFAAIRYALTICSIPVLGVTLLVAPAVWEPLIIGMLVTIPFLMWIAPVSFVRRQAEVRNAEIARGVPDLMSLISACVQQGMGVPTAFAKAASGLRESSPALAQEADLVSMQADAGTFANALRGFRDRIRIPEVATLTTVLIQSSELGTKVCDSLRLASANLRERHQEQARVRATLTPRKMIAPTLLFLIPAALLVFYSPVIVESLGNIDAAVARSLAR